MRIEPGTYRREKGHFQSHTGSFGYNHEIPQSVPYSTKFNPFVSTSVKDTALQADNEISIAKTSLLLPFNVSYKLFEKDLNLI